jgi:hypothetical protein
VPWILIFGQPGDFTRTMLMAAGWVINLAVAEWIIRKRPTKPIRSSVRPASVAAPAAR